MALDCIQFNQDEPFKKRHIFNVSKGPEGPSGAKEESNEANQKLLDGSGLKKETLKPLQDNLEKITKTLDVITALVELKKIEDGFSDNEKYRDILMKLFTDFTKDGPLTKNKIKDLAEIRSHLEKEKILKETNEKLVRLNAPVYFKGPDGKRLTLADAINMPSKITFAPPTTEAMIAVRLLDAYKDDGAKELMINGKKGFRGNDGHYHTDKEGKSPSIKISYNAVIEKIGAKPASKKAALTPEQQKAVNTFVKNSVDRQMATLEERDAADKEFIAAAERGRSNDGLADADLDADMEGLVEKERSPAQWKGRFDGAMVDIPKFMKGQSQFDQIRQIGLLKNGGDKVEQAIRDMANVRTAFGETTDSKSMWEDLHGKLTSKGGANTIDFREVFKKGAGIKFDDFFEEYGALRDPESPLTKEEEARLKEMNKFLEAADDFITLLPGLQESDINEATYLKQRRKLVDQYEDTLKEKEKLEKKKAKGKLDDEERNRLEEINDDPEALQRARMAKTAKMFFKHDTYGPPAKLGLLQRIGGQNKDGRFVITEHNWLTNVARSRARMKKAGFEKGMIPVISPANQFYMYMELDSPAQMATKLEAQRKKGMRIYKTMIEGSTRGNDEKREERKMLKDTGIITEQNVIDGDFDKDTITAVRFGAMQEAMEEIEAADLAKVKALKDAIGPQIDELTDDMIRQMLLDPENQLTEESVEELREKAKAGLSLAAVAMLQGHIEDGKPAIDALRAAIGVSHELGKGFHLDFMMEGQSIVPYLFNAATGVGYSSPKLGKKGKWQVDAQARVGAGPIHGPNANLYVGVKRDISKNGLWGLRAGAQLSASAKEELDLTATASVGVERDLDVQLELRIEKYKEANLDDLNEAREDAIREIGGIDGINGIEEEAALIAYDKTTNNLIARKITQKFVGSPFPKVLGISASAGTSLKNGGFGAGVALQMSWGGRVETHIIPTQDVKGSTVDSITIGDTTIEGPGAPEIIYEPVVIGEEALWKGKLGTKEEIMKLVNERNKAALESFGDDHVQFTPGDSFTEIDFKRTDGIVSFYAEDIETVYNAQKGDLAINIGLDDKPAFRFKASPKPSGGLNTIDVGLSENKDHDINDIKANSPYILRWIQTPDGKREKMEILPNPDYKIPAGEDAIKYRNEKTKILDSALAKTRTRLPETDPLYLEVKELSYQGAEDELKLVKVHEREVTHARLFDEYTVEADYAKAAAKKMVDAKGKEQYTVLASKGMTPALSAEFKNYITEANPGIDEIKLTPDLIYMAYNHAMELSRPSYTAKAEIEGIISGWNIKALKEDFPKNSKLLQNYLNKKKELIATGAGSGFKSEFPEGTEFFIYVNAAGEKTKLHGYYDKRIHGDIIAQIEWNVDDPDATLSALDIDMSTMTGPQKDALREQVKAFAADLDHMPWPKSPFNNTDLLKPEANKIKENFMKGANTMAGELLLSDMGSPYTKEQADLLRQMYKEGDISANSDLAKEFAETVHKLFTQEAAFINGIRVELHEEVRTGLYEKCFNLTVGHNFKLRYREPEYKIEGKKFEFGTSYETERGGFQTVHSAKHRRFAIPVTPFFFKPPTTWNIPDFVPPAEEGSGEQNVLEQLPTAGDTPISGPGDSADDSPRG